MLCGDTGETEPCFDCETLIIEQLQRPSPLDPMHFWPCSPKKPAVLCTRVELLPFAQLTSTLLRPSESLRVLQTYGHQAARGEQDKVALGLRRSTARFRPMARTTRSQSRQALRWLGGSSLEASVSQCSEKQGRQLRRGSRCGNSHREQSGEGRAWRRDSGTAAQHEAR